MASSWEHFGEIANIAQLAGFDAVRLIAMIVKAASTARMHRKSCRQFAQHLKLIGNLLEQLKITELKRYPETREPLEQLEDALRRKAQNEIDQYLKLVPLITLVDNARVRERLEVIEKDQHEYTLDEEDRRCEVIQHLLEVTEVAATSVTEKSSSTKGSKKVERNYSDADSEKDHSYDANSPKKPDSRTTSRNTSSVSSGHDLLSHRGSHRYEEWNADLLGCCSEPSLCIKTFFYPCGTFSKIATVATNRHMSSAEACNELMAYSLILSCCCYTCCVRRKLRKTLNITGGFIDDFLSHLMCCCCALVQEWREVEMRGIYGSEKTKTSPPPSQFMES
ncbi:Protein MID1-COMPLEMENTING ACTIVITY 1 [Hibiscus syriacus]|uniref:Protein MID1-COMPLEMENTING ACTIVITY 1 n=1 Tax=Hibiscus syriacus TaxID=106335 RepID=A0A6A3B313_HIBSY|nr:Protein MID1-COMPLEMENTING ACTIVITY 1 [Hibiscus syriacus]